MVKIEQQQKNGRLTFQLDKLDMQESEQTDRKTKKDKKR